ncbi:hypothetical protein C7974DRAFT_439684 [Boeremia exigua]|uniref:uncharacterized protein n=1 Tax=Boeremia exigua TaxID=749465 RepID=UPI001E8E1AC6|nr:uncharacterized protein C7974DRAFT_439684 [Boeremia exigua]KAH6644362.1 hypothetical protein C7974DRAFT_439684 [Boeremia exigua]
MMVKILSQHESTPMSPERVRYFETIRKTQVPRYLFRAFTSLSGGGQHLAINNEHEMVPHGLMDGKKLEFYSRSEAELSVLAFSHLRSSTQPLTLCTSWAASMFSVLCYATYLAQKHEAWIAVIDTHLVEEVLVFNAAQLVGVADLEYQAYGCIKGPGYKAVRLEAIRDAGLCHVFPLLSSWAPPPPSLDPQALLTEVFGFEFRDRLFHTLPRVPLMADEVEFAGLIGSLFSSLALPVGLALLCLRPRVWANAAYKWNSEILTELHNALTRNVDSDVDLLLSQNTTWPQPGLIIVGGCQDIYLWITLLHKMTQHTAQHSSSKRRASKTDVPDSEMEIDGKDWATILRPRVKKPRLD